MKLAISTIFTLLLTSLLGYSALSKEISTTRLKSTAGTGVGSLLMDEATILNPAAISFFQVSSIYIEKSGTEFTTDNGSPLQAPDQDDLVFIASDAKGSADGSISYARSKDANGKTSRLAASMSSAVGENSALGFGYSILDRESGALKGKLKQWTVGITHALTSSFSLGLVVNDVTAENPIERRAILGGQYVYKDFISLMLDAGADWERTASESSLIRAAIQLKLLNDFYVRFGASDDRGLKRRGSGAGLGWVQPRLVIEAAVARTKYDALSELAQIKQNARETSFSMSYRF